MKHSKRDEMASWLESNPGKTECDWLIEQRCLSQQQRSDLRRLLDLCDYLGVKYVFKEIDFTEELNDFCDETQEVEDIKDFKELCAKVIKEECPVREYDLYFPSKRWVINIGDEQRDVDTEMRRNMLDFPYVERLTLQKDSYGDLYDKFIAFLNEKYHYPSSDKENDSNKIYLPWGKDVENTVFMEGCIKTGLVSSFYQQLFGDDIEKASKKSIEDFLAKNPDLRKQRADMLHDYCKSLINGKKLELLDAEIQKLLRQTDKELAATYPVFKEAALM